MLTLKFKQFLIKYNPYILIALPCLVAEILNVTTAASGKYLISEYLLKIQVESYQMPEMGVVLFSLLEITYVLVCVYFLLPVFKVHDKQYVASVKEVTRAQTRVYNFPAFLIMSIWIESLFQDSILFYFKPDFFTLYPFLLTSLVSTVVTVIVIYYISEFLNRFIFIPHWFPEGKIKVSWKFRVPSLFIRFGDTFLISGILPMLTILGIIYLTLTDGLHDNQEMERLFYVCLSLGSVFWIIGALLTVLNSRTFLYPLESMEKAIKEFGEGNFTSRVTVHSDDQIGVLEAAVNRMGEELEEKEIIKTVFGHYVSPAVRDMILGGKVKTEGDKIEAVVLFSDIRSFTSLSEKHPPEHIVKLLNIHFTRIVDIVSRNDGFVDKFIGDAVMAVFDEELTAGHHKLYALRAAAAILSELEETNREIAEFGFSPLKIGIGIASGPVIRGNIGSENRREMTVIGDTVNLASRLESATKEYGSPILVTETSFDQACADFSSIRKISENSMSIRGKTDLVRVLGLDLSGI
jgi:class 3 adenylate cyclase